MKSVRFLSLLFLPAFLAGQGIDHWESPVVMGSTCRYLVPSGPVDDSWTGREYDDSEWGTGPGGAGYGDDDDPTLTDTCLSVYCRYHFHLADPSLVGDLLLDVDFDDGFVAYLNGQELARYQMGPEGSATTWDQYADDQHEALVYRGMLPLRFHPDARSFLEAGENVLALEVHNVSDASSDLSSNVYLHAGIQSDAHYFGDPPPWFQPIYTIDSTRLPLVVIDTRGQEIPDEPRIVADMGIIHGSTGAYNTLQDPYNAYSGQISIELRGESSLYFYPKKSFGLETQYVDSSNRNVSLLGLPEENDFVLYGPYGDKSLIRNVLSYGFYGEMGHYAPGTRFVELVINGDYQGLYVLIEKIKRDRNRVDMAKLTEKDTAGTDLTGGYLLRVDKTTNMEAWEYWESPVDPPLPGYGRIVYQYFDPSYDELIPVQRTYIAGHMQRFEQVLVSASFADPEHGYRAFLDIPSFIDLMILNEFTKDVDAYRLSHYFYKQRDDHGGKLVQGPPWDYNLTFGNNDFAGDVNSTSGWVYDKTNTLYWWARLLQDPWFRNELYCRWAELHGSLLDPLTVSGRIDEVLEETGEAIARNYVRWPVLGVYVWPNSYVGASYAEEEEYLRTWIRDRLSWMETLWGGRCVPTRAGEEGVFARPPEIRVYPNPSSLSRTFVSLTYPVPARITVILRDLKGTSVYRGELVMDPGSQAFQLPDLSHLPPGIYILEVTDGGNRRVSKVVRR